jgi:hypothetical protein
MKLWTQFDLRLEGIWRVRKPRERALLNFRDGSPPIWKHQLPNCMAI